MTFRAQAAADLPTFVNVDDFADSLEIEIDGVVLTVPCVVEGNGDTRAPEDGVVNRDSLLFARVSDFEGQYPAVGRRITVNEEQADIVAVSEDQGLFEIRLRWLDS